LPTINQEDRRKLPVNVSAVRNPIKGFLEELATRVLRNGT